MFGITSAEKAAKGGVDCAEDSNSSALKGVGLTLRDYQLEVRLSSIALCGEDIGDCFGYI